MVHCMATYRIFQSTILYINHVHIYIYIILCILHMDLHIFQGILNENIKLCIYYCKEGMVCCKFYLHIHDYMDLFFHISYHNHHGIFNLSIKNIFQDMDVRIPKFHCIQIHILNFKLKVHNQYHFYVHKEKLSKLFTCMMIYIHFLDLQDILICNLLSKSLYIYGHTPMSFHNTLSILLLLIHTVNSIYSYSHGCKLEFLQQLLDSF